MYHVTYNMYVLVMQSSLDDESKIDAAGEIARLECEVLRKCQQWKGE